MTNEFRVKAPVRTCDKSFTVYGRYKSYLKEDFYSRCGYTDSPDFWFGGSSNFHIDHFIPWKKHPTQPDLKTDYNNLVYSCSYVNILKSDDETAYLDPCNVNYNDHFYRDKIGNILPKKNSIQAKYMYDKLKLYMKRYQIIWMLENIFNKMEMLRQAIKSIPEEDKKIELQILMAELACIMLDYKNYLSKNQ